MAVMKSHWAGKWFPGRLRFAFCSLLLPFLAALPDTKAAGNLVASGDFESEAWGEAQVARQEPGEKKSGDHSLRLSYSAWVLSPEFVEIDPSGVYRLSAFFKRPEVVESETQPEKVTFQLALWMYDADENLINGMSVNPVEGTETRLVADAAMGSQEVRVEAEPWERKNVMAGLPYDAIAFDVRDDFSDLPNPASHLIESIATDDTGTVIRLRKPLDQAYPAGTLVRQHQHAEVVQANGEATQEWTEHSFEVSGVSEPGRIAPDKFWPGTKKVRAAIRAGSGGTSNETQLLVDDVFLIEQK